jgi:hypothetical protein
MYMCVDDRYGCGACQLIHENIRQTNARRGAQKGSAIHFGIVSLSGLIIVGNLI